MLTGLVLAGGRGSRMGAVDKGLQPLAGRPLVAHAIERLAPQVDALVVSANRHRERYAAFGHRVVADATDTFAGPLAGIHAGLVAAAPGHVVVVPCDAPWFPADLVVRLGAPFVDDPRVDATSAATAVRGHPAFCMLRTTLAGHLAAHLAAGGRSVHGWLDALSHRRVSFDDEDAFRNLNTPDELADADAR